MVSNRIPLAGRFLLLFATVAFLPAIFFSLVLSWKGLILAVVLADLILLAVAFRGERFLSRQFRAKSSNPEGSLYQTYLRALKELDPSGELPVPSLAIYADPLPNAVSLRSLGSNGSVLLSQGLLILLSE